MKYLSLLIVLCSCSSLPKDTYSVSCDGQSIKENGQLMKCLEREAANVCDSTYKIIDSGIENHSYLSGSGNGIVLNVSHSYAMVKCGE